MEAFHVAKTEMIKYNINHTDYDIILRNIQLVTQTFIP